MDFDLRDPMSRTFSRNSSGPPSARIFRSHRTCRTCRSAADNLYKVRIMRVTWTAWSTPNGPLAAWGHYDVPRSRQLNASLIHVQRWQSLNDHHALWCYCEAKRPTDWVVGRPECGGERGFCSGRSGRGAEPV